MKIEQSEKRVHTRNIKLRSSISYLNFRLFLFFVYHTSTNVSKPQVRKVCNLGNE